MSAKSAQDDFASHRSASLASLFSSFTSWPGGSSSRATVAGGFMVGPASCRHYLLSVPYQITDRAPDALFVNRRLEARAEGSKPILFTTSCWSQEASRSLPPALFALDSLSRPDETTLTSRRRWATAYLSHDALFNRTISFAPFNLAFFGGSPVSKYLHNAISSFRAKATIPTLRSRLFPLPKRRWYHRLSSLVG
jgi:hypothetical protein